VVYEVERNILSVFFPLSNVHPHSRKVYCLIHTYTHTQQEASSFWLVVEFAEFFLYEMIL